MKKICIIGAGSGIGLSLVEYYKSSGYKVDAFTRISADLSLKKDILSLAQDISNQNYDTVIFSAGIGYHRVFETFTAEQISEQVFVNTLAPLQILRLLPKSTKFVYLSSVMQYIPARNMSLYAAMKRATSQTLEAVMSENPKIDILNIDLGAVKTQMHIKAGMKKKVGKDIKQIIPKLVQIIEYKRGTTTLFWDWWIMMYVVFPMMRLFLKIKR